VEHVPNDNSANATPPRGGRYDVNGRGLLLHRGGEGGPAVVFLPGAAAVGMDYLNIHDRISELTSSVVYDRAGTGWSDHAELPRPATDVADELRQLLRAAAVPAPYVLVAHSLGGVYARRFAQLFPAEVAGLVMLDAFHEDWDFYMPEELHLSQTQAYDESLPEITDEMLGFARDLYARLLAPWPSDVRQPLIDYHLDPKSFAIGMRERSNFTELAAELHSGGPLPDVPVTYFTAMAIDPGQELVMSDALLRQQGEAKRAMYDTLAESVSDGDNRVLEEASHSFIHIEAADAVTEGIRDVLAKVQTSTLDTNAD
jgi:pimeloyl-ACP methyl ester carboxylesterase